MSVDRPVTLNVSVPDFGSHATSTGQRGGEGSTPRNQPNAKDQQRFEQALAGTPGPAAGQTPQPFALFGHLAHTPQPPAAHHTQDSPQLASQVSDAVERLMVDDSGHGSRQVRMELKDDVLPGVTVVLQEQDGRLQVDFICSVEASRLKLNTAAPEQAQTLAQRLQRDVLLRVQTDDEEDLRLFEAAGSA